MGAVLAGMTTAQMIAAGLAAASAAGSYYNTQQTAKKQDRAAAQSILNQMQVQKKADANVNQTLDQLQTSNATGARQGRLTDYMDALRSARSRTDAGLTPNVGGQAFQQDAARATGQTNQYGQNLAGLMSRIDAPTLQRQQEAFDYGNLATNLGLAGRESNTQAFIDQLRQASIHRNGLLDLASGLGNAGANAMMINSYRPKSGSSAQAQLWGGVGNGSSARGWA